MSVGFINPIGNNPIAEDTDLKGGFRPVADNTARDAIPTERRKEGMLVYSIGAALTYQLGAGLGNGDWVIYTPDATGYVPSSRTLTAGQGLTGGGDLSADRTFDVVANGDGSIAVNVDDIQVGVLATDAQHGTRGGGTQHALAVSAGAAGFMSGADKAVLDSLAPLASSSIDVFISSAGNDGNDGLTVGAPVLTWARVWAVAGASESIVVHIANEVTDLFVPPPVTARWVILTGDDNVNVVVSGVAAGGSNDTQLVLAAATTTNLFRGMTIEYLDGNGGGTRRQIRSNSTTTAIPVQPAETFTGDGDTAPGDNYRIFTPAAIIHTPTQPIGASFIANISNGITRIDFVNVLVEHNEGSAASVFINLAPVGIAFGLTLQDFFLDTGVNTLTAGVSNFATAFDVEALLTRLGIALISAEGFWHGWGLSFLITGSLTCGPISSGQDRAAGLLFGFVTCENLVARDHMLLGGSCRILTAAGGDNYITNTPLRSGATFNVPFLLFRSLVVEPEAVLTARSGGSISTSPPIVIVQDVVVTTTPLTVEGRLITGALTLTLTSGSNPVVDVLPGGTLIAEAKQIYNHTATGVSLRARAGSTLFFSAAIDTTADACIHNEGGDIRIAGGTCAIAATGTTTGTGAPKANAALWQNGGSFRTGNGANVACTSVGVGGTITLAGGTLFEEDTTTTLSVINSAGGSSDSQGVACYNSATARFRGVSTIACGATTLGEGARALQNGKIFFRNSPVGTVSGNGGKDLIVRGTTSAASALSAANSFVLGTDGSAVLREDSNSS